MDAPVSPAIYALTKLHAELGGKIKDNAKAATKLRADMKHVERVLHLLQPSFNARRIAPRRRYNPNPLFKRGTVFRAAMDVLRVAEGPMTAEEIVVDLFRSKGIESPSRDDRRRLYGAVNASLDNHLGKTLDADDSRPRRWRVL